MNLRGPSAALAALLAPACTRTPASAAPRPAPGRDPPPEDYYEAGGSVPAPLERAAAETPALAGFERVLLPPRVPQELRSVPRSGAPIEVLHLPPQGGVRAARPLVLMSPALGNTTLLVRGFARAFAENGWHAVIVQRKELAFHPEVSVARAEDEVRLIVMRSRQALDWLLCQETVDARRIGTFGVSAGAIVSSMLAGADARTSAHVWLLAGGPLSHVMAHTVEGEYREYAREAIRTSGRTLGEIRETLRARLQTDPVRLAARVRPDRVLLVLARFDRSVPYRYGLALWRALGRPERLLVPLGHYTTFLLLPWLQRTAVAYFQRHFGELGSSPK